MNPRIEELPAMKFVGCTETFSPANDDFAGIQEAWGQLFQLPQAVLPNPFINDRFWGITTGIGQETLTYIAGGQVDEFGGEPSEVVTFETPVQVYAIFEHYGNVSGLAQSIHNALRWIRENGYELDGAYNMEMYDSRCKQDDPDNYVVDLYFPVRKSVV